MRGRETNTHMQQQQNQQPAWQPGNQALFPEAPEGHSTTKRLGRQCAGCTGGFPSEVEIQQQCCAHIARARAEPERTGKRPAVGPPGLPFPLAWQ